MARSVLFLLAGAVTGGAAAWLLAPSSTRESDSPLPAVAEAVPPPLSAAAASGGNAPGGYASDRLAIYERAAQANDATEIGALIDLALDEPIPHLRRLKLSTLLARFSEIDPRAAIDFARNRYVDPALLAPLFESWARSDPDAAIAELALVTPPGRQREIALAVLGVIGNDADAVDRVAAALPDASRASLEIDSWLMRAEANPAGALRELLAMPRTDRRYSLLLPRVAEIAAWSDPVGALALSESIGDYAQRTSFRNAVVTAWANDDPDAVFAWIEAAAIRDLPESSTVYQALAASDPDRLFEIIEGLPPAIRTSAERAAMQTLAETDAMAALARLDAMPPGPARDQLLTTIAQTYGRQSPDLALAWARSLPPAQSQTALRSVMLGIAAVDPDRAFDLVLATIENADSTPISPLAAIAGTSSLDLVLSLSMITSNQGADFARMADRLVNIGNPQVRTMLSQTIGSWSRQEPDAALSWALANSSSLDPSVFANMAQTLATQDPELAFAMIDRVPPAQRPQWVTGLADRLAQNDPARAMSLIDRYRGQPEYASVYGSVATSMARTDPAAAAAVLRDAPAGGGAQATSAVMMIAREWTVRDPAAAADWARALGDPRMQTQALRQVASRWAERDPAATENWLMGMSRGTERDAALNGYVVTAAQTGRLNQNLVDAFSTPAAGQQAVGSAIMTIGRTDLQEARRLLDAYITDERIRRATEEALARTGGSGGALSVAPVILG